MTVEHHAQDRKISTTAMHVEKWGKRKKTKKRKNNRKGQPTHWLENVSKNLQDQFALECCPLSPCLAKKPKMTAIIHVDDMI
jgi:hypothetical protein